MSFAQAVFSSRVEKYLVSYLPAGYLEGSRVTIITEILDSGATGIKDQLVHKGISDTIADDVLHAWNDAVTDTFVSCVTLLLKPHTFPNKCCSISRLADARSQYLLVLDWAGERN